MAELGLYEDALAAITEAVEIRRELAAARPDVFRPNLAASLNNQSTAFAELGRYEDALAAITEAVAMYREQAAAYPAFWESLAGSLTSLGIQLSERDDFDAALSADREAATLCLALYSVDPERYRDLLQQAVNNLVTDLRHLGRSDEEITNELDRLLSTDDD